MRRQLAVLLSDILHPQSDVLLTPMTIKEAIAKFEGTESDALVVVDSLEDMHVIGMLTEQFALRRYSEHLDRQRRALSGESASSAGGPLSPRHESNSAAHLYPIPPMSAI